MWSTTLSHSISLPLLNLLNFDNEGEPFSPFYPVLGRFPLSHFPPFFHSSRRLDATFSFLLLDFMFFSLSPFSVQCLCAECEFFFLLHFSVLKSLIFFNASRFPFPLLNGGILFLFFPVCFIPLSLLLLLLGCYSFSIMASFSLRAKMKCSA